MYRGLTPLILAISFASFPQFETEEASVRRVYGHLAIRDTQSAVEDARRAARQFPSSCIVQKALIRALSEAGMEVEAIEEWQKTVALFEDQKTNRDLVEVLAWGVLNKGEESAQLNVRITALMGAVLTRDAKALPLLLRELGSSNAFLRSVAARLAASYGDASLKDALSRLLQTERVWYVRLEVIRAVSRLQMHEVRPQLKEIIGNPKTLLEEKTEAIIALVSMYEAIDPKELTELIRSNRAGLKILACEVIAHLELKNNIPELIKLLQDSSPDVRIAALSVLGLLEADVNESRLLLLDSSPEVVITAAWHAMLFGHEEGAETLKRWIENDNAKCRRLASAALAVTGKKGVPLSYAMIRSSSDPFVKANLALGLIGQRQHVELACDALYAVFTAGHEEKWMWDAEVNPLFRSLAPSRVRHIDHIPHYPLLVDQMVRLDILSVLSMMRHPQALVAVKSFLQNQSWGASGSAAATLLQEGDEEALLLIRELLTDPEENIRVQSALILALIGSDPAAVQVLQEAYPHVDRTLKMHILEALGHIGDPSSVPFLLEILKEPFQVLRVVAASALIQCLYH